MAISTKQMEAWAGDFGQEYTKRNCVTIESYDAEHAQLFGLTRTELNKKFLGHLPKDARILEIGANVGNQLALLQKIGFSNLYGVELQWGAIELARERLPHANIVQGSAFDVPFRDGWFDVVFTSNVLIHFRPDDVTKVMAEMVRCSKKYIWGSEYWAPEFTEVTYRGNRDMLWKTDYGKLFASTFPQLEVTLEQRMPNRTDDTVDNVYLLAKR